MNEQDKKVPTLRFKGFTNDWEQHKLRDVADLNGRIGFRGYTRKDIVNKDKGILAFSPTNIVSNRLIKTSKDTYITVKKYDESPEIKLKNGYVLFVKTGSTLGKSALIKELSQLATVNPQIVVIKPKRINASFMSIILLNDKVQRQVFSRKIGGAVPTLTENEINNFNFNVPKTTEQQSISEIIECLNNFLSLQQRKLDLLKQLKKGFLQKMFAEKNSKQPVLRFKGFHDDWEQRKLGEVCEKTYSGLTGKNKQDFGHGKAKYVTYLNVHDNAIATTKGVDQVEIDPKQNEVVKGDLLFTVSSEVPEEVALNSVWPGTDNNVYLNSFCFGMRPMSKSVNSFFLTYYLRSPQMRRNIYPLAQGISRFNISKRGILSLTINLPNIREQINVYKVIKNIECLITLQHQKLAKYQSVKKSLLQQMFI